MGRWLGGVDEYNTTESPTYIQTGAGRLGGTSSTVTFHLSHHQVLIYGSISTQDPLWTQPSSPITPNCNSPEVRNPMEYSDKLQRKI